MSRPFIASLTLIVALTGPAAHGQQAKRPRVFLPEQRQLDIRPPSSFPQPDLSSFPAPPTVTSNAEPRQQLQLTLDEAIRIALQNSEVVRVLTGVSAASTGQTIYDVAISNTSIDEQRAEFDPFVAWRNSFNRFEPPVATIDPTDPNLARITGIRTDDFSSVTELSKQTLTGGTLAFDADTNPQRMRPGIFPLNPRNRYALDLSYTQPLFRGGGVAVNRAPIVVARIDTERSFFQYKDSVQQLLRGVIEGYWALVFARTDLWAREQQVTQARFAYDQANARFRTGAASRGVVAQSRVSLGGFQTALTAARNNVLSREAALRNLLGWPPADGKELVPITPPTDEIVRFDWSSLVALAEQNRPDLIELKLVLEADEQLVLLARNEVNPTVDATMLYRWNGLEGKTPTRTTISTQGGQFTDWTLGVNFSVPLTLRQPRAALRRRELIIARDRANLRQGLHNTLHTLAISLRDLEQFYEQYRELHDIRDDARLNLQERRARWRAGGVGGISFLDFLLAITDWGDTISAEAQALAQYNTELARIEEKTGTILESHAVRFFEERLGFIGPLGRLAKRKPYPASLPAGPNTDRYPRSDQPAENFFELDDPLLERLPSP